MRIERRHPGPLARAVARLLLLPLAGACAGSGGPAPSHLTALPEGGFTITQDIRVGLGVRRDFGAALDLLEQGDVELAVERLVDVTEALPQLVSGHLNLGIAYGRLEEFEKAESHLRRALELFPEHPAALNELGIALRREGRFEEARRSYESALDVAPDFHIARRNLAILCDLFLSDSACALEHYERYAEAVPSDEKVGIWIADLRNRAGKETK